MVAITRCLSRFCEESKLRSSTAKGHLFVITGRLTFSAAMNLASRLEHETHATFVGEPTGSRPNHYGEAVTLTLPASGITVRVSTRYWRDSKPNDKRLWIAPEMPAPPSAVRLVAESIRLWIRSCGNSGTTTIPGRLTLPHRRMDV